MTLLQVLLILGTFLFLVVAMYSKSRKIPLTQGFDEILKEVIGLLKTGGGKDELSKEELDEYEERVKLKERKAKLVERDKRADKRLDELEEGGEEK